MAEVNWPAPDKDSTFDQTFIYRATSAYGTYSLIATLADIRTLKYVDTGGASTSWYKIRFYDSTNSIYSAYSAPAPASATISDTNYTTPKLVAERLGFYRSVTAEAVGTGDSTTVTFQLADPKVIADTEVVYLAGVVQKRNTAYTINYETGKVTFATAPASGAITADYWASSGPLNSQFIKSIRWSEDRIDRTVGQGFYQPQQLIETVDFYDPVDTSPFAFMPTTYMSDTQSYQNQTSAYLYSRVLTMKHYPIFSILQILTNAQQFGVTGEAVGTGTAGGQTVFTLLNAPVIYGSEIVYLNGVQTTLYTINYTTGVITFSPAPGAGVAVTCDYQHAAGATVLKTTDYRANMDAGLIYLNTSTSPINEQMSICTVVYQYGYAAPPPVVEDLATALAAVKIASTNIMGAPTTQAIDASNMATLRQDIQDGWNALGKKLELTRI